MLRTTAISLAAAASLTLAALTPALADVSQCEKQPNADTCPTMGAPLAVQGRGAGRAQEYPAHPLPRAAIAEQRLMLAPSERAWPSIFFRL